MNRVHLVISLPVSISICVIVFCLWAFIPGRVTEGYVIDKRYEPESTTMVMSGKVMVPMIEDEKWLLTIEGHSPARGLRKEGIRRQAREASKETYDKYEIGDWIKF